jgi:hypothetical protein
LATREKASRCRRGSVGIGRRRACVRSSPPVRLNYLSSQ